MFTPEEAANHYALLVASLEHYQRSGLERLRSEPPFVGLADVDILQKLSAARDALDETGILDLIAAIEAAIRVDRAIRLGRAKRRLPPHPQLRALGESRRSDWQIPFTDLLDVWTEHVPPASASAGRLKAYYKVRNWVAHGRYFVLKAGIVTPSVADALEVWRSFVGTLANSSASIAPRFPAS